MYPSTHPSPTSEVLQFLKINTKQEHTCDKFQRGIRKIFFLFQGGLWKMCRIYKKFRGRFQSFCKKWYIFLEILRLISRNSLKMREVSHVCRKHFHFWARILHPFRPKIKYILFPSYTNQPIGKGPTPKKFSWFGNDFFPLPKFIFCN